MDYEIAAKKINIEEDGYSLTIGFLDEGEEPHKYVLLQKTLEPDEQDEALGMDVAHIEIEDQARSGYGGIASVAMDDGGLRIRLDEKGKKFLDVAGQLLIAFESPEQKTELQAALQRMSEDDFPLQLA
ncbi:Imm10 family immunity protein [Massilia sp. MB5]|uniref:Imm10 family immunity protein n=1 Tax=Massilia sp. MB5 TaxID=2919578 RepID=UPI001F0EF587|nr:Imm10 family immunity protein [Massilia sp. MB5]UMR28898.1 Imm10 family immunity protein [Massilia sp. MB5]